MNIETARQTIEQYQKLLELAHSKIKRPTYSARNREWYLEDLYWSPDDNAFIAKWEQYVCGETDTATTTITLEELFNENHV